jgi:hypothetical protein
MRAVLARRAALLVLLTGFFVVVWLSDFAWPVVFADVLLAGTGFCAACAVLGAGFFSAGAVLAAVFCVAFAAPAAGFFAGVFAVFLCAVAAGLSGAVVEPPEDCAAIGETISSAESRAASQPEASLGAMIGEDESLISSLYAAFTFDAMRENHRCYRDSYFYLP